MFYLKVWFHRYWNRKNGWRHSPGGPRGQVVKDTNLQCSKPLIISPMWARAQLGSHVRQAKFCLRVVRWFFSGISRFRPTLRLTRLKMSEIILTGRTTHIKKAKTKQNKTRLTSKRTLDQVWDVLPEKTWEDIHTRGKTFRRTADTLHTARSKLTGPLSCSHRVLSD